MRKCVLMLILVLLNSSIFGQFGKKEGGKITVREADGTPSAADIDTVEVNNGSLTVSGNVATINIVAAAASSADSVGRDDGTIDGDSLITKTRTDTVTGAKVFIGDVTLPESCVTSDQIATNAVGSLEIAGSAVKESEINWAEVSDDSVVSRLADKIDSTHVVNGSLTNSDLKSGTIQSSRLATGAVTETKLGTSSVTEEKIKWSSVNADSAFSSVSAKVATQISDSLGRYTTNSLLDTTKADTSQWGKFVRDHQVISGGSSDSSWQKVTFVSADGDTNSWQAKSDGTLNAYATKGIGLRMPKSGATYIFSVGNDISGVDSTFTMDSVGRIGIKGAPNASYALQINSGNLNLTGSGRAIFIEGGVFELNGATSSAIVQKFRQRGFFRSQTIDNDGGNTFTFDAESGIEMIYSSGEQSFIYVEPKINQSSTAAYNAIYANVTETSTGSGAKNLFKGSVGGTEKFRVENSGDVVLRGNLQVQSDSTTHDIFVGNATFSKMNAGDANFTTSSSADLKENFQEVAKPNLETLKLYTYTWKKEALGWVDLKTIPDSVTTFSWSVDTLEDGTFDSTQVFWKIPNPEKKIHADINAKAEARAKELQYGMKSEDWDSKADRADSKSINWQEVAIKFYRLVLDHETKIKDLETRVSKLEGK